MTAPSTAAIPADPKQALAGSVAEIGKGNFTFTMENVDSTTTGAVHAPSKSGAMETKPKPGADPFAMSFIIIGSERWIKMDLGPELNQAMKLSADKWQHVDPKKITDPGELKELSIDFSNPTSLDPAGAGAIFKALVTAERQSEGKYAGTVDLTQVKDAGAVDEELVTALGEKAKAVPFTASLDAQGRLTQLTLDMPAAGEVAAHKIVISYADYGAAAQPKQPAASEVVELPDQTYEMFNN